MDAAARAAIVVETLERVADRCGGDPTPFVFARLFAENPAAEALFVRDAAGLVRGQMMQVTIESLLDFLGSREYGANLIRIERINHEGLGVDPALFDSFYPTVHAAFRAILAEEWTDAMETAWAETVAAILALD